MIRPSASPGGSSASFGSPGSPTSSSPFSWSRSPAVTSPSRDKSMAVLLAVIMVGIYIWVSHEDALVNQYSAGVRFGATSPSIRLLVLSPLSVLSSHVALSLAQAGHRVHVLVDPIVSNKLTNLPSISPSSSSSAAAAGTASSSFDHILSEWISNEIIPLPANGGLRNISGVAALIEQHDIQVILDTRPLHPSGTNNPSAPSNNWALVQRIAEDSGKKSKAEKRTYIYTSGCLMQELEPLEKPSSDEPTPPSSSSSSSSSSAASAVTPSQFESAVIELGEKYLGHEPPLYTLVLRPGVLYGGASWPYSPLRKYLAPLTQGIKADAAASVSHSSEHGESSISGGSASASTPASSGWIVPPGSIYLPFSSRLSAAPFHGLHFRDFLSSFVSLLSFAPTIFRDLTGEAYDLLDETKLNNAGVAIYLAKAAGYPRNKIIKYSDFEEKKDSDARQSPSPAQASEKADAQLTDVDLQPIIENENGKVEQEEQISVEEIPKLSKSKAKMKNDHSHHLNSPASHSPSSSSPHSPSPSASPSSHSAASRHTLSTSSPSGASSSPSSSSLLASLPTFHWPSAPLCSISRTETAFFRAVTKWRPRFEKINENWLTANYIAAIKETLKKEEKESRMATATTTNNNNGQARKKEKSIVDFTTDPALAFDERRTLQ